MADLTPFRELLRRVRAGDPVAQLEFFRRYERAVRRTARINMLDNRVRRLVGASDICQLVMHSFMRRAAEGKFELEASADLMALLARMAKNKFIDQVRRIQADHRDARREQDIGVREPTDGRPSPHSNVAWQEIVELMPTVLSEDERRLFELRNDGREWTEIATQLGETPEALRKRLERAIGRVRARFNPQAGADDLPRPARGGR